MLPHVEGFIIIFTGWSKNSQQKIKQGQMGLFHRSALPCVPHLSSRIPLSVSMSASAQMGSFVGTSSSASALLDRSSKHLPLNSKHNIDHVQALGNFFQDAMVQP